MTPPTEPRGLVNPHRLVPPGGPQGPFWGLLSSEGYVVATQILSEEDARLFAAAPLLVEALAAFLNPEDGHAVTCRAVTSLGAERRLCLPRCLAARGALALARGEA